ncbi:dihydroxyacetone kinase subunit L [Thioclava sp. BHET1]|nr:dihydroxyacetone kinase subunit L [Thioclava sp. BHET1]
MPPRRDRRAGREALASGAAGGRFGSAFGPRQSLQGRRKELPAPRRVRQPNGIFAAARSSGAAGTSDGWAGRHGGCPVSKTKNRPEPPPPRRRQARPSSPRNRRRAEQDAQSQQPVLADLAHGGAVTPARFRAMMRAVAATIRTHRDWLSELDGVIGDGDHGVTMDIGWTAVEAALQQSPTDEPIAASCERMAQAFLTSVGASSGPLYASALREAGKRVAARAELDPPSLAAWIAGMYHGILSRGGAQPGDKTMLDAWCPATEAAERAARHAGTELRVLEAAAEAAEAGAEATAALESRRGRSAKLGARSQGHKDPGAVSASLLLRAMSDRLAAELAAV